MVTYTSSAINNTFDLIKRLIYIIQIIIQVSYLGFLGYRIISDNTNLITNIILAAITLIYLIIFIMTSNEFYTKEDLIKRKVLKYILNPLNILLIYI